MTPRTRVASGNHRSGHAQNAVAAASAVARRAEPGPMRAGSAVAAARPQPDRGRYAWLYEDDDIWGGDAAGSVPPLTYGDDWHAPRL
jgi:hypothetical protein